MTRDGDPRRALPSVSALLERPAVQRLLAEAPRELVTAAVRDAIDAARGAATPTPSDAGDWDRAVREALAVRARRSLRPVINATGIVLHTNLGRAPLPAVALEAIATAAAGYSNLEYDLARGERGSRYDHCVALLRELTGAEDALVVNNGAAALLVALHGFAEGRDALVSRGELIEIGGSFRVPDIMAKSGARLIEVGTTNRTHLEDYRRALSAHTGAVVKVHRSNFALEGYAAEVTVPELVRLARGRGAVVIHDLGSGLLLDLTPWGLTGEPLAAEAVQAGADVVTMSGDKLLGGPQAGVLLGRAAAIQRLRENPLTRALRVDKLTLAALEATLALYREPERARRDIPTLSMLTADDADLSLRAMKIVEAIGTVVARAIPSEGGVGGGSFPTARLAGAAVELVGEAGALDERLRRGDPPVIGRIVDDRLRLDLRSVPAADDAALLAAVRAVIA